MPVYSTQPASPASTTEAVVDRYGALEVDDDGLVLEFPTSTSPIVLTPEDFDGALGAELDPPRNLTITTTASVGTYVTTPWAVESTAVDGSTVTEAPALTDVDGDETVAAQKVHGDFTSITIPAMNDANGTIKIGVGGRVGLRFKAFYTAAGEQPHTAPTVDGAVTAVGTISKAGAPPYGAIDFTGTLDGFVEVSAIYTRDLL